MKTFKKILVFIIITGTLLNVTIFAFSTPDTEYFEKVMLAFTRNKDKIGITEEEFKEEIKHKDPGKVLFAASLATSLNMDIKDIYEVVEEKGGNIEEVKMELFKQKDLDFYKWLIEGKKNTEKGIGGLSKEETLDIRVNLTEEEKNEMKKYKDTKQENKNGSDKDLLDEEKEILKGKYDKEHPLKYDEPQILK